MKNNFLNKKEKRGRHLVAISLFILLSFFSFSIATAFTESNFDIKTPTNYSEVNVNHSLYSDYAENWVTSIGNLDSVNTDQFELQGSNLKIDEGYLANFVDVLTNLSDYWRKDGVGDAEDMWDLGVYGIISQASYFQSIVLGTLVAPKSYIGNDGDDMYIEPKVGGGGTLLVKEGSLHVDNDVRFKQFLTNGFLKTTGTNGTLIVDTNEYYLNSNPLNFVNTTYNDSWINLTFYNKTYIDSLEFGNSSFNQSLTDSLYYLNSNPRNFINTTYNDSWINQTFYNKTYLDLNMYSDYGYFKELQAGYNSNNVYNMYVNGSSIYWNIISEYNVTGSISPDLTGVYTLNGTFNGKPAFSRVGGGWLYYESGSGLFSYALSETLGNDTHYFFSSTFLTDPPLDDSYTAWGGYEGGGTATITALELGGWDDVKFKWDEAYSWGNHSDAGYVNTTWVINNFYNKTYIDSLEFGNSSFNQSLTDTLYYPLNLNPNNYTTNASALAYVNSSGLLINWSGIGNTDTTYTAGSNLTLTGTTFALNTTSVQSWLETIFVKITDLVGLVGNWSADKTNYYNSSQVDNLIPSNDIDSGLISWWRMDDGNSTQIFDYTGSHNGTITGATYTDGGMIGKGMSFDGNDRIDIPASTDYDVQRLTLTGWVYSANYGGPGGGNGMFIFEKGYINTQYSLFFNPSLFGGGPVFRTYNSAGTSQDLQISQADAGIVNGNWYYLTAVYDGSEKIIYLDGQRIANKTYTETLRTGLGTSQRIGAYNHATTPGYYFNGIIDEFQVYNRGLSATEVMELYQKNSLIKTNLTVTKDIFADRYIVEGKNGWSGNCVNVSVSNGIIVGCND